jgi:hypothetical protein
VAGRTQHHLTHQTSVCGGGGQRFIPHIGHQPVEGMRTALSHTSGISSWRGWASHCPTHRASACGGDGHRILPHIGQALPGSGRLLCNCWVAPQGSSPHDHKRVLLCRHPHSIAAGRGQSPWFAIPMGTDSKGPPATTTGGSGRLLCNGWLAPQGSSSHDHKRVLRCIHPRSFAAGRGQSSWFAILMGTGRERHLCFNMVLFGQALFWCIGIQVV